MRSSPLKLIKLYPAQALETGTIAIPCVEERKAYKEPTVSKVSESHHQRGADANQGMAL